MNKENISVISRWLYDRLLPFSKLFNNRKIFFYRAHKSYSPENINMLRAGGTSQISITPYPTTDWQSLVVGSGRQTHNVRG